MVNESLEIGIDLPPSRNRSAAGDGPNKIEEIPLSRLRASQSPTRSALLNMSEPGSQSVRAHHARASISRTFRTTYTRDGSPRRFFKVILGNLRNRGRGCARARARERGIMRWKLEHGRPAHVSDEEEEEEGRERCAVGISYVRAMVTPLRSVWLQYIQ